MAGGGVNLTEVIANITSTAMSNPYVAAALAIQFLLGLALGYVAGRAAKYILAFIGILVLGAFLNVWSLGQSTSDVIKMLGEKAEEFKSLATWFLQTMGLMTIGPTSLGFVVGLLIAFLKK